MKPRRRRKFGWQRGGKPTKSGPKKVRETEENILGRGDSESVEQRESTLQDLRRRFEERLESETPEQRAERLHILSQNVAKRIESETPEQRAERLGILSSVSVSQYLPANDR